MAAASLDGKIVIPEHAGWDDARRAWQLNVDQRPAAVVYPESPDDVVVATLFAREWGLRIAAQATGHNAGALGPLEDTVLLKTERMRGLSIDPTASYRTCRRGHRSGATWYPLRRNTD